MAAQEPAAPPVLGPPPAPAAALPEPAERFASRVKGLEMPDRLDAPPRGYVRITPKIDEGLKLRSIKFGVVGWSPDGTIYRPQYDVSAKDGLIVAAPQGDEAISVQASAVVEPAAGGEAWQTEMTTTFIVPAGPAPGPTPPPTSPVPPVVTPTPTPTVPVPTVPTVPLADLPADRRVILVYNFAQGPADVSALTLLPPFTRAAAPPPGQFKRFFTFDSRGVDVLRSLGYLGPLQKLGTVPAVIVTDLQSKSLYRDAEGKPRAVPLVPGGSAEATAAALLGIVQRAGTPGN